jgi:hypothetical protein
VCVYLDRFPHRQRQTLKKTSRTYAAHAIGIIKKRSPLFVWQGVCRAAKASTDVGGSPAPCRRCEKCERHLGSGRRTAGGRRRPSTADGRRAAAAAAAERCSSPRPHTGEALTGAAALRPCLAPKVHRSTFLSQRSFLSAQRVGEQAKQKSIHDGGAHSAREPAVAFCMAGSCATRRLPRRNTQGASACGRPAAPQLCGAALAKRKKKLSQSLPTSISRSKRHPSALKHTAQSLDFRLP